MTDKELAAIKDHLGADEIHIEDDEVRALGDWARGDGGGKPWWKFAGYLEDVLEDMRRNEAQQCPTN